MWQEGQEEEELFDDVPESFVLCALHQAKIIRERWKFWSGSVPADVSIHLHRLESRLSINEENRQEKLIPIENKELIKIPFNTSAIPLQQMSKINSSQPFLTEIPKQNIIIQGPDIHRIVREKRRVHFWCCH